MTVAFGSWSSEHTGVNVTSSPTSLGSLGEEGEGRREEEREGGREGGRGGEAEEGRDRW